MRRGRIIILLAIIVILVLGGVWLYTSGLLTGGGGDGGGPAAEVVPTPVINLTEIIVVTQNVSRGAVVNEDVLGTIEFPQENIIPGMFLADQMEAVVGRQAKLDIDSGMPLTAGMLVDVAESLSDTGSIAALSIPKGKVAIPVPVDRHSSVAYALRPGDHVSVIGSFVVLDVDTEFQTALPNGQATIGGTGKQGEEGPTYLTTSIIVPVEEAFMPYLGRTELDPLLNELVYVLPAEAQRPRLVTQILMQDAIVLKFGEFSYDDLSPQEAPAAPAEGDQAAAQNQDEAQVQTVEQAPPPDVVVLIVSPQEAVSLEFLMKHDIDFTLVLRASGDSDPIDTEATTFQYLLETYNIPVPAKLPYGLEPSLAPQPAVNTQENQ